MFSSALCLAPWVQALGIVENKPIRSELTWSLTSKGEVDDKQVSQLNTVNFMVDSPLEGRDGQFETGQSGGAF